MALLLLVTSFSLAESDYEEGDGWIYRDGELKITENEGLINFLYHEYDMRGNPQHKHSAEDVDHAVIGKDVTDIIMDDLIGDYNPSSTSIEEGNSCFVIDQGWVVNMETKTLFGAANVKQNKIESVINSIPSYIENIGMFAFSNCSALTQISIPDNVVNIGESCFYHCDSLESIALPNRLTSIGIGAFAECTSLKFMELSPNVKEIGTAAFFSCIHLETPPFYNMKLDTIHGNSFWGCDTFQTVEFPPTLKKVENQAFTQSVNLKTLIFNSEQLIIENGAFDACENIRKLIFTKGKPASIGDSLFGENEKSPDGKSFISRVYDKNGTVIPYPTLYYTAAYADEWAPNGETEWNGYPIQQISQEELDAILAEARGEVTPMISASPLPTETPLAETSVPDETDLKPVPILESGTILFSAIYIATIAIVVIVILRRQKAKK